MTPKRNRKVGDLTKDEAFGCLLGVLATTLAVSLGVNEVSSILVVSFDSYLEEICLDNEETTKIFAEPKVANIAAKVLAALQNAGYITGDRRRQALTHAARLMSKSGEQLH